MKKLLISLLLICMVTGTAFASDVTGDATQSGTAELTSETKDATVETEKQDIQAKLQPFFYVMKNGEKLLIKYDLEEKKFVVGYDFPEDQLPYIEDGRTYVPFRFVFETLLGFKDLGRCDDDKSMPELITKDTKLHGGFVYGNYNKERGFSIKFYHGVMDAPAQVSKIDVDDSQKYHHDFDDNGQPILTSSLVIDVKNDRTYMPLRMFQALNGEGDKNRKKDDGITRVNTGFIEENDLIYITNAKAEYQNEIVEQLKKATNINDLVSKNKNDNYRAYATAYYTGDEYKFLDETLEKSIYGVSGDDNLLVFVDEEFKLGCYDLATKQDYLVNTKTENGEVTFLDAAFYDNGYVYGIWCENPGDFAGKLFKAKLVSSEVETTDDEKLKAKEEAIVNANASRGAANDAKKEADSVKAEKEKADAELKEANNALMEAAKEVEKAEDKEKATTDLNAAATRVEAAEAKVQALEGKPEAATKKAERYETYAKEAEAAAEEATKNATVTVYKLEELEVIKNAEKDITQALQMCMKDGYCWYLDAADSDRLKRIELSQPGASAKDMAEGSKNILYYAVKSIGGNKYKTLFYNYEKKRLMASIDTKNGNKQLTYDGRVRVGDEIIAFNTFNNAKHGYDFCFISKTGDKNHLWAAKVTENEIVAKKLKVDGVPEEGARIRKMSVVDDVIYVKVNGGDYVKVNVEE